MASSGVVAKFAFGAAKVNALITLAAVARISVVCLIQRFPILSAFELQKVAMRDKRLGVFFDY